MEKIKIGKETFNANQIQSFCPTSWEKEGVTKHAVKVTLITKSFNDKGYNQNDVVFVLVDSAEEAAKICE